MKGHYRILALLLGACGGAAPTSNHHPSVQAAEDDDPQSEAQTALESSASPPNEAQGQSPPVVPVPWEPVPLSEERERSLMEAISEEGVRVDILGQLSAQNSDVLVRRSDNRVFDELNECEDARQRRFSQQSDLCYEDEEELREFPGRWCPICRACRRCDEVCDACAECDECLDQYSTARCIARAREQSEYDSCEHLAPEYGEGKSLVLYREHDGAWEEQGRIDGSTEHRPIEVGDLDGDGEQELLLRRGEFEPEYDNESGTDRTYLVVLRENFEVQQTVHLSTSSTTYEEVLFRCRPTFQDVSGDGHPDIRLTCYIQYYADCPEDVCGISDGFDEEIVVGHYDVSADRWDIEERLFNW